MRFTKSLFSFSRRPTIEVNIGSIPLGGNNPVRIQSMTTIDTMDTKGSVEQCVRMINSGCEYIRITAPSITEAQNLENIKNELRAQGYETPLVADIHFTPNAAELAAKIVEKVRVNPGNYADKKKFDVIEYDDDTYNEELKRIRDKFEPLVKICKEHGTALRIGTNHGSLSDRIMSRYGDTPIGMVESALEFLRICEDLEFYDCVISMKSSNAQVMVQAYRLLAAKLEEEGLKPYPLHLGVTEAGEGEDGRIKSALGIGTLLEDGLGDTIRVSLTEEPEFEAPIAKLLADRYANRAQVEKVIDNELENYFSPYEYQKRVSKEIENFGGANVPRVIADFSDIQSVEMSDLKSISHHYLPATDKWGMGDLGADYIYTGANPTMFMLPNGLKEILDFDTWELMNTSEHSHPLVPIDRVHEMVIPTKLVFILAKPEQLQKEEDFIPLKGDNKILILSSSDQFAYQAMRRVFLLLLKFNIDIPVVVKREYTNLNDEQFQLNASTDAGGLFIDGFGDGIWLNAIGVSKKVVNSTSFGILQASRTRMSKAEYISCPSCGRTLFDLQETTAMIRKRTDHLKGVKIGIMGCIVNGPGEMADADYGYVGSGKGKITLYKGKEVMKRGVPSEKAVDQLIDLIKEDGIWFDPSEKVE